MSKGKRVELTPDEFAEYRQMLLWRVDIVDIVRRFARIRPRKRTDGLGQFHEWIGLCPFHVEMTPSFVVIGFKQIYSCFGCGSAGNVITFLMEHQEMTYGEAMMYLARYTKIWPQRYLSLRKKSRATKK